MNLENINLTEELILKAGACQTVEELTALAQENGIDITPEQLPALMAEVARKCSGELSDDALEAASAVGGKASYTDKDGVKYKVVTVGYSCRSFRCKKCRAYFEGTTVTVIHHNPALCYENENRHSCGICQHMVYMDGLWLCSYGNNFIV